VRIDACNFELSW